MLLNMLSMHKYQIFVAQKVITQYQHACQKNKCAEKVFGYKKDKIIDNFEQKYLTIGIFLHFKKAFDSSTHGLLKNLNEHEIKGLSLIIITR